jgi:hypothetical protein
MERRWGRERNGLKKEVYCGREGEKRGLLGERGGGEDGKDRGTGSVKERRPLQEEGREEGEERGKGLLALQSKKNFKIKIPFQRMNTLKAVA